MGEFHGTATAHVEATPDAIFDLITDIDRLPDWNAAIESVAERPPVIDAGAEWVVVVHPAKLPRWKSRSRVEELDRSRFRFAYRTQTDDGNPSYALWTWQIAADDDGAQVTVSWDVYPKTLGRRVMAPRIRAPQLRREVPMSLAAIGTALAPPGERAGTS